MALSVVQAAQEALPAATDAELGAMRRALKRVSRTNCAWTIYAGRAYLAELLEAEAGYRSIKRRHQRAR